MKTNSKARGPARRAGARALAVLVAVLVVASLTATPAQAADSRSTLLQRTNHYHGLGLKAFMKVSKPHDGKDGKGNPKPSEDTKWLGLDWRNDGCSAPNVAVGKAWNKYFKRPCVRHDFGYRNLGKGLALHSTNARKKSVDDRFLADMNHRCATAKKRPWVSSPVRHRATVVECEAKALVFYGGVRKSVVGSLKFTNPETAWHGKKCTDGALCIFDDKGFKDTRWTFGGKTDHPADTGSTSVSSLKSSPYDFNDKTSAVWNRTGRAWRLYDDTGFKDRSVCVKPGQKISDLKKSPYKFNDKTSSLKRLSGTSC